MGRQSARKLRQSLRPGVRERARVKKHRRGITFYNVPGAGTFIEERLGRKKARNNFKWFLSQPIAEGNL
jgi:hypothetical protein